MTRYDKDGQPIDIGELVVTAGQCQDGRCLCWNRNGLVRHCPNCNELYMGDGRQLCRECESGLGDG